MLGAICMKVIKGENLGTLYSKTLRITSTET